VGVVEVSRHGGPSVLTGIERPVPVPAVGEALIRHEAIGVNFVDSQHRKGAPYPIVLPFVPGIEAAGTVVATGAGTDLAPGDRVAFVGLMCGVYAEFSCVPQHRIIRLPEATSTLHAAASLMQAMTAHALAVSAAPVSPGDAVLVHAAASGVGRYLVQIAKRRGAFVVGTVSTEAKRASAESAGADVVLIVGDGDLRERIHSIEPGGVGVVFDGSGQETFDQSLDSLRSTGRYVLYGLTSGSVPLFDVNRLSAITGARSRGSLNLTWATLSDYTADRSDLVWRAAEVLDWVASGSL
jgi:NADPH:quinone reductase